MEESRPLPDPTKLMMTRGVSALQGVGFENRASDYLFPVVLNQAVKKAYDGEPDTCFDGGNDKYFFTLVFRGQKLFVAANEVNGLTIMLPEEY
jgi:hypothetical protein